MSAAWLDSYLWGRRPRLKPPAGDADSRFLDLPLARVRYKLIGAGPPVVLVPDPPNTVEHYDALAAELSRDHRVLCLDPPGFGLSVARPGFGFTLPEQAEVLSGVLGELRFHGCTLSVSCLGAFAGLIAASRRPDLIARLVVLQMAAFEDMRAWSRKKDVGRVIQTPVVGQLAMKWGARVVARHWYRSALPAGTDLRPYLTPALRCLSRGGCFCLASAFQAVQAAEFRLDAPLRQPTVVVWGTADGSHAGTRWETVREQLPRATVLTDPTCGHFPDLENRPAYARALRDLERTDCD